MKKIAFAFLLTVLGAASAGHAQQATPQSKQTAFQKCVEDEKKPQAMGYGTGGMMLVVTDDFAKSVCEETFHPDAYYWDLGVFVQGGNGLEDRTSFHFLSAGIYAGRILTNDHTALRANFEYGVEVLPVWQSYSPKFQRINCPYGATSASQCSGPTTTGGTYRGFSIVPIILRINMNHGRKLQPWLQGAGGLIYTTRKFPPIGNTNYLDPSQTAPNADTSVWNFDPQFGIGAHYFLKPRRSIDVSANAVHISSSSLGDKNPGINTGVQFTLGYSWWK